jgi:hypothetical protein
MALADMIQLEMRMGAFFSLNRHISDLLSLRRPDYAVVESIYRRLQSDRFLFTQDRSDLLGGLENILDERASIEDWSIWQKATGDS